MDVREDVTAVHALDCPDVTADVAWEPRVRPRMHVARAHAVADGEPGLAGRLALDAATAHQHRLDVGRGERADRAGALEQPALIQQPLEPRQPDLVIRPREVVDGVAVLARE